MVYDPFVPQEQEASRGSLLVHYPEPLVDGDEVFLMSKGGAFSGLGSWSTQTWLQTRLHWEAGRLVEKWTFATDGQPAPDAGALRGWEPVHHAALARDDLYAPGFGGTVHKLSRADGAVVARINPFGGAIGGSIFVSGPLSVDGAGNVFLNALRLDLTNRWGSDVRDAWLVRIVPDGSAGTVRFATLTAGAPRADDLCPDHLLARPAPLAPERAGRPPVAGLRLAATRPQRRPRHRHRRRDLDGESRALRQPVGISGRGQPRPQPQMGGLGCASVSRTAAGCPRRPAEPSPRTTPPGGCRSDANPGVDPATNRPGDGEVNDRSSPSPTVAPDGAIFYGAYTRYNYSRIS